MWEVGSRILDMEDPTNGVLNFPIAWIYRTRSYLELYPADESDLQVLCARPAFSSERP